MPKIRLTILSILIIVVSAVPFVFIYPNGYGNTTVPASIKYLTDALTIITIFSLGYYIFRKISIFFIRFVWVSVYLLSFLFIAGISLYLKVQTHWDASTYNTMMAIFTMIASPVPFIILLLVNTIIRKTIKK